MEPETSALSRLSDDLHPSPAAIHEINTEFSEESIIYSDLKVRCSSNTQNGKITKTSKTKVHCLEEILHEANTETAHCNIISQNKDGTIHLHENKLRDATDSTLWLTACTRIEIKTEIRTEVEFLGNLSMTDKPSSISSPGTHFLSCRPVKNAPSAMSVSFLRPPQPCETELAYGGLWRLGNVTICLQAREPGKSVV
ncbi:uncharacterized protein LOC111528483 isoform X2 [Piliocolobus tephrosceles]|uniref:uncharacterized protein LOC111528483 isoform X2 n=1 Tax=Piliocolobus tephrosceles TaxID=591936 RepID=UPI000E6AEC1B|nr:uncharacterized protein LOC111528483 isoform X2 [Piliocolobus tephrosceles]